MLAHGCWIGPQLTQWGVRPNNGVRGKDTLNELDTIARLQFLPREAAADDDLEVTAVEERNE